MPREPDRSAGGRDACQIAAVRAGNGPVGHRLVPFGHDLVHGAVQVGQGLQFDETRDHRLVDFRISWIAGERRGRQPRIVLGRRSRRASGAELLHQAQRVPAIPGLLNPALRNAGHGDRGDRDFLARCRDAHQFALLGSRPCQACDDHVGLADLIVHSPVDVGDGGAIGSDQVLEGRRSGQIACTQSMKNRVGSEYLVCHIECALIPDLLKHAMFNGLVGLDVGRGDDGLSEQLDFGDLHAVDRAAGGASNGGEEDLIVGVRRSVVQHDGRSVLGEARPFRRAGEIDDVPAGDQRVRPVDTAVGAVQLERDRIATGDIVGGGERHARHDGRTDAGLNAHTRRSGVGNEIAFEVQVLRIDVVVDRQRGRFGRRPVAIVGHTLNQIARRGDIGHVAGKEQDLAGRQRAVVDPHFVDRADPVATPAVRADQHRRRAAGDRAHGRRFGGLAVEIGGERFAVGRAGDVMPLTLRQVLVDIGPGPRRGIERERHVGLGAAPAVTHLPAPTGVGCAERLGHRRGLRALALRVLGVRADPQRQRDRTGDVEQGIVSHLDVVPVPVELHRAADDSIGQPGVAHHYPVQTVARRIAGTGVQRIIRHQPFAARICRRHRRQLDDGPQHVAGAPGFHDLAVGNAGDRDARLHDRPAERDVRSRKRPASGDPIGLGDDVLHRHAKTGERAEALLGCELSVARQIRNVGPSRIVVHEVGRVDLVQHGQERIDIALIPCVQLPPEQRLVRLRLARVARYARRCAPGEIFRVGALHRGRPLGRRWYCAQLLLDAQHVVLPPFFSNLAVDEVEEDDPRVRVGDTGRRHLAARGEASDDRIVLGQEILQNDLPVSQNGACVDHLDPVAGQIAGLGIVGRVAGEARGEDLVSDGLIRRLDHRQPTIPNQRLVRLGVGDGRAAQKQQGNEPQAGCVFSYEHDHTSNSCAPGWDVRKAMR